MRKKVGSIVLPKKSITLHYYVFGNRKGGFGVQILQCCGEQIMQNEIKSHLTRDWLSARNFARLLAKGAVFPYNLSEICEDYQFEMLIGD